MLKVSESKSVEAEEKRESLINDLREETVTWFSYLGWKIWNASKVLALGIFLLYVAVPIFIRANPWILPKIVFSNIVRWPPAPFINLDKPQEFGLNGTNNFYLEVEEEVQLGVWHVLPKSLAEAAAGKKIELQDFESLLASGKSIIVYLHGNSGTRGGWHRVQLYKLLASLECHVVTMDYRGFGDSSGSPTEDGVVADAYFLYKWVLERSKDSPVFLWGHSLGTAVTTKLAKILSEEGIDPLGIVLESPFNNIFEAAAHHPFTVPFRFLPWFSWVFIDTIRENGINFSSDESIQSVSPPLLIMHAEDDAVVPFHLGQKLYHAARSSRQEHHGEVKFISFSGHYGYGHKYIFKAPELPRIILEFMEMCIKQRR